MPQKPKHSKTRTPGIYLNQETQIYEFDKKVRGVRIRRSSGTSAIKEAELILSKLVNETRDAINFGIRPSRTWREAATEYLLTHSKRSLEDDAGALNILDRWIGDIQLDKVNLETLAPFIVSKQSEGVKNRTVNSYLEVIRCILNLAADEWRDDTGLTWLREAPKIKLLPRSDQEEARAISWAEQDRLLEELPPHLSDMILFALNTGARSGEITQLRWEYEYEVDEQYTVFIIPRDKVKQDDKKGARDRLLILNKIAQGVVEKKRGDNQDWVFTYKGNPIKSMNNSAWKKARARAGFKKLPVHWTRHTCLSRLRAAGVSEPDRRDIAGHRSQNITAHYSHAEIYPLIEAVNTICNRPEKLSPVRGLLRKKRKTEGKKYQ